MKKLTLIIAIVFSGMLMQAQEYVSNRQSYSLGYSVKEVNTYDTIIISIEGDNFKVKLPTDGSLLTGTLTLQSDETTVDGKKYKSYLTDKGCPFSIFEDYIFLNLDLTHNAFISYYFNNYVEPTEEENRIIEEMVEYKIHVELYGKFTADCIKEGVVKPGMDGIAVFFIFGTPNQINQTETKYVMQEQLVYDDKYVYLENGIVTAIQSTINIK